MEWSVAILKKKTDSVISIFPKKLILVQVLQYYRITVVTNNIVKFKLLSLLMVDTHFW
jgi:hypothetical protein